MIDFSAVKATQRIKFVGDSWAFGGEYIVCAAEETYGVGKCPDQEKEKLLIVEFMNDGSPMFFTLDMLRAEDWEPVNTKCPDCGGSGQVGYAVDISDYCPCPTCGGAGKID